MLRQASEAGQLFGSVSPRDLVSLITEAGFDVNRSQIALNAPIKTIGQHNVPVALHPEIETSITVIVARNDDEAARIARGEDVTQLREEPSEAEAAVAPRKRSSSRRLSSHSARARGQKLPKRLLPQPGPDRLNPEYRPAEPAALRPAPFAAWRRRWPAAAAGAASDGAGGATGATGAAAAVVGPGSGSRAWRVFGPPGFDAGAPRSRRSAVP